MPRKCRAIQLTLCVFRLGEKIKNGNLVLTTHRILFFKSDWGLEVPLCYITSHAKLVSLTSHLHSVDR